MRESDNANQKERGRGEGGEIGLRRRPSISTAVAVACMWMWDCGERVGQLDVFIKMEQGVGQGSARGSEGEKRACAM